MKTNEYRKRLKTAINNAKQVTNVTQVMESLGINRGNVSGFLSGNDKRLSISKVEALLAKLENPESCVTNQEKLATYSPKKAANMLSSAFFNYGEFNIPANMKGKFTEDVENWLKAIQEDKK